MTTKRIDISKRAEIGMRRHECCMNACSEGRKLDLVVAVSGSGMCLRRVDVSFECRDGFILCPGCQPMCFFILTSHVGAQLLWRGRGLTARRK
jgi:hypothetical protein